MDEINDKIPRQRLQITALATASLVLGLSAIVAVVLSIQRVEALQELPGCLVAETPGYRVVHSLCTILPTVSLAAGIVAIMRMLRGHRKLWSMILASGGVTVSLAVLVVYWINMTHLASGHLH